MSDTNTTLNVGVAKAYWGSKESKLLVSNPQFGERKCINVAVPGSSSTSKSKNKMSRHGSKKGGTKKWVHPPEALLRGHIVYNVKFLGNVAVENPKGTDVVKEAIRKMKFNKQIKKAEGQKPPKVELTISVDGVTIQEPKYKVVQHQYPLHRISYCADDKSDKRMLTFIGKAADSDEHHCFVFDSDKCAEEITLTIGQAFDLAYKKFLEKSAKDIDLRKQFLVLQKKVQQLTQDNLDLKARCADLERLLDPTVLTEYESSRENNNTKTINNSNPTQEKPAEVGRKLENLVFDDLPTANNTWNNEPTVPVSQMNGTHVSSPSTTQNNVPMLSPPPPVPTRSNVSQSAISFSPGKPNQSEGVDMFGQKPFTQVNGEQSSVPANPFSQQPEQQKAGDPFGMVQFNPTPQELEQPVYGEKELMDLQLQAWENSWPWNYLMPELKEDGT